MPPRDEWARRVKVDLAALRSYAKAIYDATDDYLASLTDHDVKRFLDLSDRVMGQQMFS